MELRGRMHGVLSLECLEHFVNVAGTGCPMVTAQRVSDGCALDTAVSASKHSSNLFMHSSLPRLSSHDDRADVPPYTLGRCARRAQVPRRPAPLHGHCRSGFLN